ncbi:beta-1,3-galactosyltransferase brn-like isoform X2 [Mytilus californianus]|nr:beta-1,3-galactosyltransferase brn-like isoform X2 [Mytilus californianus]XP_052070419.1 beta-1,3-galactosyltransferase brn-like isoform X2 [Mytilus californianus]XP_052070424.1 beta-1,3-galactosyltransferase brn-like isoform X2 [Mytilus californianus]
MTRLQNAQLFQMFVFCTLWICCVYLIFQKKHEKKHIKKLSILTVEKLVFDINNRKILNKEPVNNFKDRDIFLINRSELLCGNSKCDSLEVLFIVKSYVLNFGQREAIRRTWGGMTKLRSKTVFIIGYLDGIDYFVDFESEKYKDIVQLNVNDKYQNVVYKTIYALLWLSKINITSKFIHFVDDDRFVNPLNMYDVATQNINSADLIVVGYLLNRSETIRDKSSKTYVSPEDYPFELYPPYIIGGTILTNEKTVGMLAVAVEYMKVIPIEDAYIGMVAHSINISLKHHPAFLAYKQNLSSLHNGVSSPGYENTYILMRDWNFLQAKHHSIHLKKKLEMNEFGSD